MDCPIDLPFNQRPSTVMHVDLNSCFATLEQQANPRLRGKPVAVAAYTTPNGCVVAPSIEAKQRGVKTGMRVKDAQLLAPGLIVLAPDPAKYRHAHLELRRILGRYTDRVVAKSIDEFVLDLAGSPLLKQDDGMVRIAHEIKRRICHEIGEWVRVSIGIAPNRFLAKTAAGLHKPDGLDHLHAGNARGIYRRLALTDLCGIDVGFAARLHSAGIWTVEHLADASVAQLKRAFRSVVGVQWYYRMRGWEIDDVEFDRKSFGHSYSLPDQRATPDELAPILSKLVHNAALRMRQQGYACEGVHVAVVYRDRDFWQQHAATERVFFDERDIYRLAFRLLKHSPHRKAVKNLAVSVYDLVPYQSQQLSLLDDVDRQRRLVDAMDDLFLRYGPFCLTPGIMVGVDHLVPDRISFGGVKELLDVVTAEL
jgi:DNA polymerase IV